MHTSQLRPGTCDSGRVTHRTGLQQGQLRAPPWSDDSVYRWGHSAQAALFLKRASEASLGWSDDVTMRPPLWLSQRRNCPRLAGTRGG